MEEQSDEDFLIVTGSSAGGIDALNDFVAGLSPTIPAAVVIAQHLDPSQASRLAAILAHRTALPVHVIAERVPLVRGTIYVAPPDRDVLIVDGDGDGVVAVPGETRIHPKPSIDALFRSAAERYGERAIAIVFSGMGSDGLAGARVVKEQGGTVIVQDPVTARHPSMPAAIPPTLVDLTAPPTEMAATVEEVIARMQIADRPGDQQAFTGLLNQLRERSGIDFSRYKMPTIARRLARLVAASGCADVAEYARFLQSHPEQYQRLFSAFLIKVTEFFRDAPLYKALETSILPRLIAEAAGRGGELRIWSAGTSTGEEAYSLAIICSELLRERPSDVNVRIFATDVDGEVIEFARRGVYDAAALRHVPPEWVERYFVRMGDAYEVSKRIRNMTVFGQHDLGQRAPFPNIDLCTCRNVLIYFTRELQTRALQLFTFALRDGGVLVLGKAESVYALGEYFHTENSALKIFRRQGERILIPPTRLRASDYVGESRLAATRLPAVAESSAVIRGEARGGQNETVGAFVTGSSIGVVVVDADYDIVHINATARTMLGIHGVAVGDDLVHAARGIDVQALRDAIDASIRAEEPAPFEMRLEGSGGAPDRRLWVSLCAERGRSAAVASVAVMLVDVTEIASQRDALRARAEALEAANAALGTRVADVGGRHGVLLRANDELIASNADLRGLNEQLMIAAEEAASANEEIETLNEEMQATNEELETLNEELQATVEELNTTNDELEARGAELERLSAVRERDLRRLGGDRTALQRALARESSSLVVLDDDGGLIYASPRLVGWVAAAPLRWWTAPEAVIGGRRVRLANETFDVDGARYHVVQFDAG